jgi:hypothetical protein
MPSDNPLVSKRSGGPKTVKGKAISARNSLKHGLHSSAPVAGPEQQVMALQVKQLTAYYRPQSPLEHLQIQRIARCAAKLETLYAIERAKAELALLQAQATDDQALLHFAHYPAAARHLAMEILQPTVHEPPAPPIGLTDRLLDQLCQEVDTFVGVLEAESDLSAHFPKLVKFLQTTTITNYEGPFSADHRLWLVAKMLSSHISASLNDPLPMPATGPERVDQFLRKISQDEQLKDMSRKGMRPRSDAISYQSAVRDDLEVFRQLHQCRRQARQIAAQFPQVKALLAASTMMPGEDSDRLMRYQTTLEKQLSRYVGELLQLRLHPRLPQTDQKERVLPNEL